VDLFILKGQQESWRKFYYKIQREKTKTNNRWPQAAQSSTKETRKKR